VHSPDFVIAGAMKSGTTWLHDALASVPGITIPRDEVHLLDVGDPVVHPDFQRVTAAGLELAAAAQSSWAALLGPAERTGLLGFDSTTLFHSRVDLRRIAREHPHTRFIVLLRNPVERAYSHYWHLVRTGRARFSFEKELLFGRTEILDRSLYRESASRFATALGSRVLFLCYERLFKDPQRELVRVIEFLGLPDGALAHLVGQLDRRSNPGRYPRWLGGWLFASRLLPSLHAARYARDIGASRSSVSAGIGYALWRSRLAALVIAGAGITTSRPPMRQRTLRSLSQYLRDANAGLDDVVGGGFEEWWFPTEEVR
jgi:hypothetical protein